MSRIAGTVHVLAGEREREEEKTLLSAFFSGYTEEKKVLHKIYSFSCGAYGKELQQDEREFFPGENEKDSFVLLDGFILNRKPLCELLRDKGTTPYSGTPEELLLLLYRLLGENAWEKLEGSFAFALYDGRKKLLYLVRDRLGSRNIYYFNTPVKTVFASSPGMLKMDKDFPDTVNEQSLWDFLSLQYVPSGTVFRDVRKILPGAFAKISFEDRTFCTVKKWWKIDFSQKDPCNFQESCAKLRDLLFTSVENHLTSIPDNREKGIFLSGGVDSAIIGGIASKIAGRDLKVFSMGFTENAYDEREQAQINFRYMKSISGKSLTHFIRPVTQENTFSVLEKLASSYGEPYADASLLPTTLLCEFAKEQCCSLALCGDGADELFGGYERYFAMGCLDKIDRLLPLWCRRLLFASGRIFFTGRGGERGIRARGRRFMESMEKSGKERYFSIICHTKEESKKIIAGNRLKEAALTPTIGNFDPAELLEHGTGAELKERASEFDLANYLPNDCLMKAERASKNAFLDVRAPFLHEKIIDFSLHLPYSFKESSSYRKKILCETFADLLPEGLARRKKKGFGVPLAAFFRQGWKEDTARTLLEGCLVKNDFFDADGIGKILKEHNEGKRDHSYLIFSLLMAELSLKK
ncbi:MAG: hypothetical protein IKA79_06625 [Lentisphaeria bacterium]|nr:hypothetical protein [Lentisphaeria bacterium]